MEPSRVEAIAGIFDSPVKPQVERKRGTRPSSGPTFMSGLSQRSPDEVSCRHVRFRHRAAFAAEPGSYPQRDRDGERIDTHVGRNGDAGRFVIVYGGSEERRCALSGASCGAARKVRCRKRYLRAGSRWLRRSRTGLLRILRMRLRMHAELRVRGAGRRAAHGGHRSRSVDPSDELGSPRARAPASDSTSHRLSVRRRRKGACRRAFGLPEHDGPTHSRGRPWRMQNSPCHSIPSPLAPADR